MNTYIIIIPTYNEAATIETIVRAIAAQPIESDILVVDDNSPDGTSDKVKVLQREYPKLHLVINEKKDGLAHAYKVGFAWGMERNYTYFCQMDADFSHDPKYLQDLFDAAQKYDFAIGSRYVKWGGVVDWNLRRRVLSRGGSLYARAVLSSPYCDQTGGFNIWKRAVLQDILPSITSHGYVFQVEMKYRAYKKGYVGMEVPIVFTDRKFGQSKMDTSIMKEALFSVLTLRFSQRFVEFAFFSCIGGTSMVVNLSLFFVLADLLGVFPSLASTLCFVITALSNYVLNHTITFQRHTEDMTLSLRGAIKYLSVALGGLGINLLLLNLVLYFYPMPYFVIAQGIGIAGGMLWNFFGASKFVFARKGRKKGLKRGE